MVKILSVNPTRMELIKLKKKIKLTTKGHRLLKEKLDALVIKFLDLIKKEEKARGELEDFFSMAFKSLIRAQAISGALGVTSASLAVRELEDVEVSTKNIMGVKIPQLNFPEESRNITNRGYGPIQSSIAINEATRDFEKALKYSIEMAELENSIQLIGMEVEKTKRRVNALEYIMIPRLGATAKFIEMRLDEMEREDLFRLKKIKAKISKKVGEKRK